MPTDLTTISHAPIVIVADDNVELANSLSQLLEIMGCRVFTVHDGREAVAACEQCHPVLVILDINMPEVNGCEAARMIRHADWQPDCIAAHTALQPGAEPLKSGRHLFQALLTKPLDFARLAELVEALPKH